MDNNLSQIPRDKEHPQHFSFLAPFARRVTLAGDFNHWSPESMPMIKHSDGSWHLNLALRPGPHQYRFVADGVWADDPTAKQHTPNRLGGQNAVRMVIGY
jgi:1,4-alpha-glucan branching enzyme